jgi:thiol-disulfide isomerase/thioredoxin
MLRIAGWALMASILVGCSAGESSVGNSMEGKPAPDAIVVPLESPGTIKKISDFSGKVVLIDFWATWCAPCIAIMPQVDALHKTYGPKGLEVMAISDEDPATIKKFKARRSEKYPVYLDPRREANSAYGVVGIPTLVVIDRKGQVAYVSAGDIAGIEKPIKNSLAQ